MLKNQKTISQKDSTDVNLEKGSKGQKVREPSVSSVISSEEDTLSQLDSQMNYYLFLYQKTDGFRQNIYFRCSIITAICAFLIGCIWNILNDFPTLSNPRIQEYIFLLILSLFLCTAIVSIFFSVFSIKPGPKGISSGLQTISVISAFPYISKMKREDFKTKCINMNKNDLVIDMLDGIYNLSIILNRRYNLLKRSCFFMFIAVIDFALLILYYFIGQIYGIWG